MLSLSHGREEGPWREFIVQSKRSMCSGYYGPERYFVTTIVREGLSAPILQMKTLRPREAGQMLTTR